MQHTMRNCVQKSITKWKVFYVPRWGWKRIPLLADELVKLTGIRRGKLDRLPAVRSCPRRARGGRNNDFAASKQPSVERKSSGTQQSQGHGCNDHPASHQPDVVQRYGRRGDPSERDPEKAHSHHRRRDRREQSCRRCRSTKNQDHAEQPLFGGGAGGTREIGNSCGGCRKASRCTQQQQAKAWPASRKGGI